MASGLLKRSGAVILTEPTGRRAARGVAHTHLRPHCNGIWIDQFRWEPDYQPPSKSTDQLYDLFFDDATENRVAQGYVSPDAPDLTSLKQHESVEVCFNVLDRDESWFTE